MARGWKKGIQTRKENAAFLLVNPILYIVTSQKICYERGMECAEGPLPDIIPETMCLHTFGNIHTCRVSKGKTGR